MDRNGPDTLQEKSAEISAADTIRWLDSCTGKYQNVKPILTPRFIPSCSDELMKSWLKSRNTINSLYSLICLRIPARFPGYRSFARKAAFTGMLTGSLISLAEKTALPLWHTVFTVRRRKYSL